VSASPTQITEGGKAKYVIRASSAVAQATTVNYAMNGTASQGRDYQLNGTPGRATIAAGKTSTQVQLNAKKDQAAEGTETAIMTLQPGSGYTVGSPSQATISITDRP
jgi:hypothetical protein